MLKRQTEFKMNFAEKYFTCICYVLFQWLKKLSEQYYCSGDIKFRRNYSLDYKRIPTCNT